MKKALKVVAAILGVFVFLIGWAIWSHSYSAPRFVRAGYDHTVNALFDYDFQTRCAEKFDGHIGFLGGPDCGEYGPSTSFRGIYIDEFEGQSFLEGAQPASVYQTDEHVWLTIVPDADISAFNEIDPDEASDSRIWLVHFSGRNSTRNAAYGHFGMFDSEILVEKVKSAELLNEFDGYVPETVLQREF
jgi:hypothetical protein